MIMTMICGMPTLRIIMIKKVLLITIKMVLIMKNFLNGLKIKKDISYQILTQII